MQNETELPMPRESNARGILILMAAMPPLGLALYALAGPIVAVVVCLVYAAALGITVVAERRDDMPSRDPATGLPDRGAALARLEGIFAHKLAGSSQAGVFVISLDETGGTLTDQSTVIMATARLAEGLRRGDQIIRTGENSLAAILGPSRGLTARAAEGILARIDGMFREPIRVGSRSIPVRVSLGACLQHDAPKADAASWIEAAELASQLAAEDGEPRLFPSGATKVDRSAWDEAGEPSGEAADDALWHALADGRSDDTIPHAHERRRRGA